MNDTTLSEYNIKIVGHVQVAISHSHGYLIRDTIMSKQRGGVSFLLITTSLLSVYTSTYIIYMLKTIKGTEKIFIM